jgi:hypothetical protein
LSLVRALRKKGYRTAISGAALLLSPFEGSRPRRGGSTERKNYLARFDALRYGEAIDTSRLASILCTPAMLRHVTFRTAMLCDTRVTSGFGYAPDDASLSRAIVEYGAFPQSAEERFIIPDVSNAAAAGAWLEKVSAQFA